MRKKNKKRKLSREKSQRESLLVSLASNLFLNGRIKTTLAKAKEVRSFAEKMITKAKKQDLHARRKLQSKFTKKIVDKLIKEVAPDFEDRNGGYTRVLKLGPRERDGAKMALIELVKEDNE